MLHLLLEALWVPCAPLILRPEALTMRCRFVVADKQMSTKKTNSFKSFLHAINFGDFILAMWRSISVSFRSANICPRPDRSLAEFYIDYARGKPETRLRTFKGPLDFEAAFAGVDDEHDGAKGEYAGPIGSRPSSMEMGRAQERTEDYSAGEKTPQMRGSADERGHGGPAAKAQ